MASAGTSSRVATTSKAATGKEGTMAAGAMVGTRNARMVSARTSSRVATAYNGDRREQGGYNGGGHGNGGYQEHRDAFGLSGIHLCSFTTRVATIIVHVCDKARGAFADN